MPAMRSRNRFFVMEGWLYLAAFLVALAILLGDD